MTNKENRKLVKEFLSLPLSAFPSAKALDDKDVQFSFQVWHALRAYSKGEFVEVEGRVLVKAQHPGWTAGIIVSLND